MFDKKIQILINLIKDYLKDPFFLKYWEDADFSRGHNTNRLSISLTGQRKKNAYAYNGYSFMFVEDMHLGIMPILINKSELDKNNPATIYPKSKEKLIADAISSHGLRNFFGDSLSEFIRNTMLGLIQQGIVFYEIVYEKNNDSSIKNFSLEFLPPFYLFRFFNNYYQFIPWWEAKILRCKVRLIKIPKEKIVRIDFPKKFGNKRTTKKILKRLYNLSQKPLPDFQMEALKKNKNSNFNLEDYKKNQFIEIAKLTEKFGWNQRQLSNEYITEYYFLKLYLRKKKTEAHFRYHINSILNSILQQPPLKIQAESVIQHLPTFEEIEKLENFLEAGDIKFEDIIGKFNS